MRRSNTSVRCLLHLRRAAVIVAAALLPALAAGDPALAAAQVGDQIVVRHRADVTSGGRADARHEAGVTLEQKLSLTGVEVVETDGSRADALAQLRDDPGVLWAEPNRPVTLATSDPYWEFQYALENLGTFGTLDADIDAEAAWAVSRGAGVTVGVVDSGVDGAHPDLAGQLVPGRNFVSDGQLITDTSDGHGHGTHVAGTVAAVADNDLGTTGAAPDAKVQPLRALDASGSGSTAIVAAAFDYAGDAGLRVVNASLGATAPTFVERQAIQEHPNTLFVVAAGNSSLNVDGGGATSYPCRYTEANVLCVGASTDTDEPASFSNSGSTSVDLFAPGDQIASTYPGNQYVYMSGTSMASPLVAAVAALVVSAHPGWTAAQVKSALLGSADHPAALAGLSVTGGRLNAAGALAVGAEAPVATTPPPTTTPPATTPPATTPSAPPEPEPAAGTPTPTTTDQPGSGAVGSPLPGLDGDETPATVAPPVANVPVVVPRLTALRAAKVNGRVRGLRFHLSAPGTVSIEAARRKARGQRALVRSRTLQLPAGPQYLPTDRSTRGLALAKGTWRISVATEHGGNKLTVTIR